MIKGLVAAQCNVNLQIDARPSSERISDRNPGSRHRCCPNTVTELSPCCRHSLIAFLPPSRLDNVHSNAPWPLPPSWWTICPCWLLYIRHFSSCQCLFSLLILGSCFSVWCYGCLFPDTGHRTAEVLLCKTQRMKQAIDSSTFLLWHNSAHLKLIF